MRKILLPANSDPNSDPQCPVGLQIPDGGRHIRTDLLLDDRMAIFSPTEIEVLGTSYTIKQ